MEAKPTALSIVAIFVAVTTFRLAVPADTQLGEVLCRPQDQRSIEFAVAAVHPGESLFVFPYQPIWYSLTSSSRASSNSSAQTTGKSGHLIPEAATPSPFSAARRKAVRKFETTPIFICPACNNLPAFLALARTARVGNCPHELNSEIYSPRR